MSDRISDIRRIMDQVMQAEANELRAGPELLNEGLFDGLKSYMQKRQGRMEREEVAAELMKGYNIWLGKMDRQGTMADIEQFLGSQLGLDSAELDTVLGPAAQAAPAPEAKPEEPQAAEPEAEAEPEEEPEAAEPETAATPEAEPEAEPEDDTPEYDPEEGRPIPADLDTKLSDYDGVGYNEFHAEASTYKNPDGSWNEDQIIKKLEQLGKEHDQPPVLILGNDRFSLDDNETETTSDDELQHDEVAAESVMEDAGVKVAKRQLKDIFNKAAVAWISKNGGRAAGPAPRDAGGAQAAPSAAGAKSGGKGNGDNYDLDRMWQILQSNGMAKGTVTKMMNKVRASSSPASLSDNDMQDLALLGFAFLKSGL